MRFRKTPLEKKIVSNYYWNIFVLQSYYENRYRLNDDTSILNFPTVLQKMTFFVWQFLNNNFNKNFKWFYEIHHAESIDKRSLPCYTRMLNAF